jgi:ATP-dependent helicase/DNAse subunit B
LYVRSDKILTLAADLPILKYLFAPSFNAFVSILKCQETLLELILKSIPDQQWDQEAEAVKQALAVIESLIHSFEADDFVSIASGKIVLTQLLSQQKLTFVGAENRSLHVMGLLETRTLDFDRVIVLSMNEGSLPGTRKRESLIPLDIANMAHFSLPTFTQADAVASYHFYRLLQRPREVVLCYVQSSDKSGVKEMSRFIKQIKHDWKRKNPLIEIHEPWIDFSAHEADFERNDGSVEKSPVILDKIKSKLANSGLSTSSITMFSTCSLKYFYAQILGMRKEKQLEDELGADVFGTWVHKVLELVDKEVLENYEGVYDRVNLADVVLGLDGYLEKAMALIQEKEGVFEVEKGFNFVLKEVAKTLLESYYSKSNFSKNTKIIDLESVLTANLKVAWEQEILDVKLTGRIDRLDVLEGREIRIIDYKTGKVEKLELKSGELGLRNSILTGELKPKILQLWLYKYLLASELLHVSPKNEKTFEGLSLQTHSIKPGIISFRNLKEGVLSDEEHDLWFESGPIWDSFLLDSHAVIEGWVHKILDVNTKFEKTKEVSDCQYCDFKVICQREL